MNTEYITILFISVFYFRHLQYTDFVKQIKGPAKKNSLISIGFCKNHTIHTEQLLLFFDSFFDAILHYFINIK